MSALAHEVSAPTDAPPAPLLFYRGAYTELGR
jgi:hypothetical protein